MNGAAEAQKDLLQTFVRDGCEGSPSTIQGYETAPKELKQSKPSRNITWTHEAGTPSPTTGS